MRDLTIEWRHFIFLNYKVPSELLTPYVPKEAKVHLFEKDCYVSLVAQMCIAPRIWGVPIKAVPMFEQISLRFYVRRVVDGEWRNGSVILKAMVARTDVAKWGERLMNHPYQVLPMRHSIHFEPDGRISRAVVEYQWSQLGQWCAVKLRSVGTPDSVETSPWIKYFAHRPWIYSINKKGETLERQIEQPYWYFWESESGVLEGNQDALAASFGKNWCEVFSSGPDSSFLVKGSPVILKYPRRLM